LEAALWVWPLWTLLLFLGSGRGSGLVGLIFIAGVGALWLTVIAPCLAIAACALPPRLYSRSFAQRIDASALVRGALLAAAVAGLGHALAQLPPAWVPAELAFHGEIHAIAARHVAAAVVVACLVLASGLRRVALPRWWLGVLPLVAVRLSAPEIVLVSRAHLIAFELGALAWLLACAIGVGRREPLRARWLAPAATAALACIAAIFFAPSVLARGGRVPGASDLAVVAAHGLDFDGDGHASLLGGRDCDPWNSRVHPVALEIVGNGRDDNCFGGDLRALAEPEPLRIRGQPRRSLVLVTVDALQARMLAPAGSTARPHMPELARFAAAGAHFTRHYVHASFTNDSVGSIMTGQYPMNFSELGQFLGMNPTLAQLLHSAGYSTATVNQAAVRRSWYGYRGFSQLDLELAARHAGYRAITSAETSARAIARFEALRVAARPFFLWVHYMDPHLEYMAHAGTPFPGDGQSARYHQEVWTTDRALGRLLRHLEATRFTDEHVVAVTADHGEQVEAADGSGHGWFASEDVLRAPLVLRGSGVARGVYATRVRAVDLYPTLLDLTAGISAPGEGAHLRPIWKGDETADRDVFARVQYTGWSLRAAIVGRYKLVADLRTGEQALYDLSAAGEARDLSAQHADVVQSSLRAMGRAWDRSMNDVVLRRRSGRM
jgi:arylsulfatase A-like enzyme